MKRRAFFNVILLFVIYMACQFKTNSQTQWRFAVLGDTHIGISDTLTEMIPYLLADNVECVLVPGDIVEAGMSSSGIQMQTQLKSWQSAFASIYAKGIGVYPIRGNHENDAHNSITAWNTVFSGNSALPTNGPTGEENLTYSFIHKNALFIGLDEYVNIHKVNQTWLNAQLAANTQPNVFVFGHEPAFKVFHTDCLDDSIAARNTFWKSLKQAGVRIYFCGHDHFVDVAKVDDGDGNTDNDIYQYLVGTGGGWLMSQYSNYNGSNAPFTPNRIFHDMEHGYALVEVSGSGATDKTVTVTWKKRNWNAQTSTLSYIPTTNIIQFSSSQTGVNQLTDNPVSIYPNPVKDILTVKGICSNAKIINLLGYTVWSGNADESQKIDVSGLNSGMYFLKAGKTIKPFIISR